MRKSTLADWLITLVLFIIFAPAIMRGWILTGISAIVTLIFVLVGTYHAFNWSRRTAAIAVAGMVLYASSWVVLYVWGAGSHATLAHVIRNGASWTPVQYWSTVLAQFACVSGILIWLVACGTGFIKIWYGPHTRLATR